MEIKALNSLFARKGVFQRSKIRNDARGPRIARAVILTIVGFLTLSIWLASVTTIPEVTRASGKLKPMGGYRQVQSSEGGIVFDVLVAEGEKVERHQVLAILRSGALGELIGDVEEEIRSSQDELSNLKGIVETLSHSAVSISDATEYLRADGLMYAASRLIVFASQQSIHAQVAEQLEQTLVVQKETSILTAKRIDTRKARLVRVQTLHAKGLVAIKELDEQHDKLNQLHAAQIEVDVRLIQTKKELNAARALMDQDRLNLRGTLIAEIFKLEQKMGSLSVRMSALVERNKNLEIRAPETGIIQAVAFPNFGEVVTAGEIIFELLPTKARLMAEIEFDPADIGHIFLGDTVSLKMDTFDARRYGQVSGEISSFSPSLVVDPKSAREFFRATVSLNKETIGSGKWERTLQAGMVTTAEVVTGERTAIAYLIKPVSRSLENAFGER
ncbi:HlyD family type I secretion periplasmic adaptor subunit [Sulfitobacter sp. SK012]|uniref:HlyD family type I secretion periplasmic adaptor subunit n=1 Tax=Sulfitobacter sp. SK012 TaxID=1389005 RepID=UPI000E0B3809|nr:HlyD family type I secretion periplasmic adaptor subunit [Sulfitobacter sp. SK012]AXI48388.1 HlyD family type I secretion periplasmic adaptor subunit [Sulfitobacter sp. SK012]